MSAGEGPFTRTREPAGAAMEELARQKLPPSSISPMPPAGISFVTSANAPVWTNSGAPPLPDAVAEASALFPRNTVTRRRRKKRREARGRQK